MKVSRKSEWILDVARAFGWMRMQENEVPYLGSCSSQLVQSWREEAAKRCKACILNEARNEALVVFLPCLQPFKYPAM